MTEKPDEGPRARIFVYGSCLSRDTLEYVDRGAYQLTGYVARQSVITTAFPPVGLNVDVAPLGSKFQRFNTAGALRGDALSRMRKARPDVVLWDFLDERGGVYKMLDGTFVTRSIELERADLRAQFEDQVSEYVSFGSPTHLELYGRAVREVAHQVADTEVLRNVIVVAPPWATEFDDGSHTGSSFSTTAAVANFVRDHYVEAILAGLPDATVLRSEERAVASLNHKWGPGPFHYVDAVYEGLAAAIADRVALVPKTRGAVSTVGAGA